MEKRAAEKWTIEALDKEIEKAGSGVKLEKTAFALESGEKQELTIEVPPGATIKNVLFGVAEIRKEPAFVITVAMGARSFHGPRYYDPIKEVLFSGPDLRFGRDKEGAYGFVQLVKIGYLDYTVSSYGELDWVLAKRSRDDCLLMIRCARTLAPKTPPSKDVRKALEALHVRFEEKDGKVNKADLGLMGTDSTLEALLHFPDLEEVGAAGPFGQFSDAGWVHLAGLKKLRVLNVYEAGITDKGLVALGKITGLEKLTVQQPYPANYPITNAGLAHLASLTNLQTLQFTRTDITDDAARPLARDEEPQAT